MLRGIEGIVVEVEVRISAQLPRIDLVGLPEATVRESAARVRAAIAAAGFKFPDRRVTVNLAPAAVPKSGAALDLPIAVGILRAAGAVDVSRFDELGLIGELALDGRIRGVRGALPLAAALERAGCDAIVVPSANASEAALAPRAQIFAATDLGEILRFLTGGATLARVAANQPAVQRRAALDLADVRGQGRAKRALAIAAAGGHGLLLCGPPGSGKTLLASRLPGLLPALSFQEALEVTQIYSAAGQLEAGSLMCERPFRAPHHSATRAGVLGGGQPVRPGEASLAHRGVLFLDEFPEFDRATREALRQVLESRQVRVVRASGGFTFPADFQFVAAANPCPCGWRGSRWRPCRCTDFEVRRYAARLSGPLLDRVDLSLRVPALRWTELEAASDAPTSQALRDDVVAARAAAAARLAVFDVRCNAEIPDRALETAVRATAEARTLLGRAVDRMRLTVRGAHRVLRVARTVADLAGEAAVTPDAIAEALSYRDGEPAADGARRGTALVAGNPSASYVRRGK